MPRDITLTPKREDPVLITGRGCYAGDAPLRDPLAIAFVRSPVACGRITDLHIEDAAQMPGVQAVYTASDTANLGALSVNEVIPLDRTPAYPILAGPQIAATGQPLAAVVADTLAEAMDAAELVMPDIEEETFWSEVMAQQHWQAGDAAAALAQAAHVVRCTLRHPRLAPSPMEPRAISVAYDDGKLTIWHATQTPHRTRSELAAILGIDPARLRVIAEHVGGAFGMKASLYPEEVMAVQAALWLQRDIRWQATRSDDFLSATHGRGIESEARLALDADGNFLALEAQITAPLGPWLPNSALIPAWNAARILPSGYRVPALDVRTKAVSTPEGPTGIYRGAGRPEANALMERLIDAAARRIGLDPLELRRRNLLKPEDMPHQTATGNTLDSGNYPATIDGLRGIGNYDALKAERDARRSAGALAGLGTAFYLEPSGSGWESARVTLQADGTAQVASGSSSQGHARETAYARIAAQALGIDASQITVTLGDTARDPAGIGALASRSTAIGGSAVLQACREARAQEDAGAALPITAEARYEAKDQAWGHGAYLVLLTICRETGIPTIEKALCIDDAGVLIDASLVLGQVVGGFAQGLGEALMERVIYDEDGQLLTGSLMDYALPRAVDVPLLEVHKTESPSPMNLLGAKGVGEAGTIGAPAAILNAAIDALAPMGVTDLQMPLTPHRLWTAMQGATPGEIG